MEINRVKTTITSFIRSTLHIMLALQDTIQKLIRITD